VCVCACEARVRLRMCLYLCVCVCACVHTPGRRRGTYGRGRGEQREACGDEGSHMIGQRNGRVLSEHAEGA
jgi:hypothetical protein